MENSVLVTMYLSENFRKKEFVKNGNAPVPSIVKDDVILSSKERKELLESPAIINYNVSPPVIEITHILDNVGTKKHYIESADLLTEIRNYLALNSTMKKENDDREKLIALEEAKKEEEKENFTKESIQNFKFWALNNGNDYLKDLINFGFDWIEEARDQYLQCLYPDFSFVGDLGFDDENVTPNKRELTIYKELSLKYSFDEMDYKFARDYGKSYFLVTVEFPTGKEEIYTEL